MEIRDIERTLALFGIPASADGEVRGILARLVAAESLSLGELQTSRDIMKRTSCEKGAAYLFLAAMFLSQRGGNAFLRPEKGAALLKAKGYLDEVMEGAPSNEEYFKSVDSAWGAAMAAAKELEGDIAVKRVDGAGDCWFFQKNLAAVEAVSGNLAMRAEVGGEDALLDGELEAATGFNGFSLNEMQLEAVRATVKRRFAVITGGPGTGKTTVVCAILRALMARGLEIDDIALAAPTGRAAQRMGEALRAQCANAKGLNPDMRVKIEALDGTTIHSLLGGFPPNWKYNESNRLPLKLVVVDESSMIDLHLMKSLVAALHPECRLVLLGDKDQLPSVDVGALLGDIVGGSNAPYVVRLVESKRFTAEFAACAGAVNDGDKTKFESAAKDLGFGNVEWIGDFDGEDTANRCFRCLMAENAGLQAANALLTEWARHYGLLDGGRLVELASDPGLKHDAAIVQGVYSDMAAKVFAELERSRILSVVRRGPYGVYGINELLLKARFNGRLPSNPLSKAGVPVIVTRNTPSMKLWNGDVGVTVEGKGGMVAIFPRGKRVVCCPVGLLPEHELAYAMTIHKSQGSEFENVMVVLPDDRNHPLLNRQIVYTGITRAKKRAVILGTDAALAHAIATRLDRDSGVAILN